MNSHLKKSIFAAIIFAGTIFSASAQYGQIVNQATNMLQSVLTAGANYKGYVEASYMKGFGENNGDFAGVSTSQGVMYGPNFFMGVGLGADALMAHVDESLWNSGPLSTPDKSVTKTGFVMPLFTDFRGIFNTGNNTKIQIGVKVGCSFLLSDSYIEVNRGYITSNECFYLKPSIGVRIPLSDSGKQGFNITASYQLVTPTYRGYYNSNNQPITLNSFGLTLGLDW